MSEPIKISTSQYVTKGKVDVDGNIWEAVVPGAGTQLTFSQASRLCKLYGARIENLEKKIDSGSASENDLDNFEEYCTKYDENEKVIYEVFLSMFSDGTPENSQVKKWVDQTPTAVLMLAFEDLKNSADDVNKKANPDEGQGTPEGS